WNRPPTAGQSHIVRVSVTFEGDRGPGSVPARGRPIRKGLRSMSNRNFAFAPLCTAALLAPTLLLSTNAARAQNPTATISVNATPNRHAIDPRIYGVAFASTANLTDLNFVLNRYGGNSATQYNWQVNADNRGSDWYFESIGDTSATAGERGDTFISNTKAGGA